MSGFTIPNTPDAANQNQAEPDSLDFQILGNQKNGIVSGMAVTPGSGQTVAVASGEVLINGSYYTFGGISPLNLTAYASTNFFDVIYARVSSGTITCYVAPGTGGIGNPRYPSTGTSPGQINPDTDVVLASVWRSGATAPTVNEITDKRIFVRSSTSRVGATATGGNHADIWVQPTSWTPSATLEGPLSVNVNGTWYKLARHSANFTAGTITASSFVGPLSGNADTATNATNASYATVAGSLNPVHQEIYLAHGQNGEVLAVIKGRDQSNGFYLQSWRGTYEGGTPELAFVDWFGNFRATSVGARSDARLKKDITYENSELGNVIDDLKPATFKFIEGNNKKHLGFIAQDVEEVLPIAVESSSDGWLSVDFSPIVAALVAKCQDLEARLKNLEAQ